jgi:hypothetical protein
MDIHLIDVVVSQKISEIAEMDVNTLYSLPLDIVASDLRNFLYLVN